LYLGQLATAIHEYCCTVGDSKATGPLISNFEVYDAVRLSRTEKIIETSRGREGFWSCRMRRFGKKENLNLGKMEWAPTGEMG
jgi:hypothetical protein